MSPRKRRPARSEIAGNTICFPIAVTHWLGTAAAIDFLASGGLIQSAGAAALFGLGERPPRRLAEFATARAGNREATLLVFRPLQSSSSWCRGKSGSRQIVAHMLGKVQQFVLGERHESASPKPS
jgi:hypothetical protein